MKLKIFCLLISIALLCGCERDNRVDIISFCKGFNKLSQSQMITEESLIKEPDSGDYIIYIGDNNGRTLLRVSCDSSNAVSALTVTGKEKEMVLAVSKNGILTVGRELPERLDIKIQNENENYSWFESDGYYTFCWEKTNC